MLTLAPVMRPTVLSSILAVLVGVAALAVAFARRLRRPLHHRRSTTMVVGVTMAVVAMMMTTVTTATMTEVVARVRRATGQPLAGDVRAIFDMGIGLSIVDAVARAHGGVVEVHSQPGAGATFTLLVPVTLAPSHLAGRPLPPPTHLDTITGSAPS